MKHKSTTIYHLISLILLACTPNLCFSSEGNLDDISIQVIGLDEIPQDALERIPMPTPHFDNLTDIREGIILNRTQIIAPATDLTGVNGPETGAGTENN